MVTAEFVTNIQQLLLFPFNGLFSRTTWVSWHQKWSKRWSGGSDISLTICRSSAPCSRQITMPAPHHSKVPPNYYFIPMRGAKYSNEYGWLSACISQKLHSRTSSNFLCMLIVAVAPSSSGGAVMLRTSGFHTIGPMVHLVQWQERNSLNFCIDSNQILFNDKDQQLNNVGCTLGWSLLSTTVLSVNGCTCQQESHQKASAVSDHTAVVLCHDSISDELL